MTNFKKRILETIKFSSDAERRRFEILSIKELRGARIHLKIIETDKEVKEAWYKFNKNQADYEKYCRRERYETRHLMKSCYMDFSHLAYNGVADDF